MALFALVGIGLFLLLAVGFVVIVALIWGVAIYNSLVRLKNDIQKSFANIDVLLKQRSDELPKLIASVKGYMKHEKSLLTDLTAARTAFLSAKTTGDRAKADATISGCLKTLFAVSENYPNLKANENFIQLQNRISGIENELADRREFYNDSVNTYNIKIQRFPDMIVAKMFGHTTPQEMFKASEEDRKDVKVEF